jgi:hypothetical protein
MASDVAYLLNSGNPQEVGAATVWVNKNGDYQTGADDDTSIPLTDSGLYNCLQDRYR